MPKVIIIRVLNIMCPGESKNTVTCYNVRHICFLMFDFQQLNIMKLVTHLGYLSYKVTTSLVILMSSLDITSRINIHLLDLLSQLHNQLHSLIRYHFKSIHSTPQIMRPFFHMYEIFSNANIFCFVSYLY